MASSASSRPSVNADVQGRPKTLEEAQQWMRERLVARTHPMNLIDVDAGLALIDQLTGLDGESWSNVWGKAGDEARAQAEAAVACRDTSSAQTLFMRAHGFYFMGRFPSPTHPAKLRCAQFERETYLAAGKLWSAPVRRVVVPFKGRADEGHEIVFLYRGPPGVERPPVVVMWGGVDAWKEQMTLVSDAFLSIGVATVALDNPGTGESPVRGVVDAERQFLPVLEWVAAQAELDGVRVGLLGRSFGGYWATKLAHLYPQRIAGAVSWGGGVHHMFQPGWVEASRYPDSYLMDLVETRCRMLGAANDREYVEFFKRLSLLDQGLLEQPSAPLLLVNGKFDRQCPIEDIHVLTEHGSPKTVRLFPGGHMGLTPRTLPTIVEWLAERLSPPSGVRT